MELEKYTDLELRNMKRDIESELEHRKAHLRNELWGKVRNAIYEYCVTLEEPIYLVLPSAPIIDGESNYGIGLNSYLGTPGVIEIDD